MSMGLGMRSYPTVCISDTALSYLRHNGDDEVSCKELAAPVNLGGSVVVMLLRNSITCVCANRAVTSTQVMTKMQASILAVTLQRNGGHE